MTHSTALTLAPCPMCGSDKISEDFGAEGACIRCRNCGCQSGRVQSEAGARAAWNRRPELAASADAGKLAAWEDPKVQEVYEILCADDVPPEGQHWEGFAARRIVAALSHPTADAGKRKTSNPHKGGTGAYLATEHYNEGWNDCLAALSRPAPAVVNQSLTTAPVSAQGDEVDAARYRWLRGCGPYRSDRGAVVVNWPLYDNGRLIDGDRTLDHEELDAAIDAARAQQGGQR